MEAMRLCKKNSGVRVCVRLFCELASLEGLQRLQCHERGGLLYEAEMAPESAPLWGPISEVIHEDEPEPVAKPEVEDKKAPHRQDQERERESESHCHCSVLIAVPKEKTAEKSNGSNGEVKKAETSPKKARRMQSHKSPPSNV